MVHGPRRIVAEFSKTNCKRKGLDAYVKRFGKHEAPTDHRHASGRPKHARTEENVTTVDEQISPQSQEGPKQTHRSTGQISNVNSVSSYRSFTAILI